jgi:hypothetical protein
MPLSLGELLVRRKLQKDDETRLYESGQYHVTMVGEETTLISWVDGSGAACMVFCTFEDDEWSTHPQVMRAGYDWIDIRPIPRSFAHNERWAKMIATTKKERRTSSGSKKKSDAPDETEESASPA